MSKDRYAISSLNPHTHAGCDNRYKCNYTRRRVSIHTPTQGVTKLRLLCFGSSWFQSTHPRRVWPSYKIVVVRPFLFQSTHPRRVWLRHITDTVSHHEFQSTHPRRVWHSPLWYPRLSMPVSIHTPTQGVTNITIRTGSIHSFNPHTHAGCDNFDLIDMFDFRVSIHTPTQGVTRREMVLYSFSWVSIHTPTQGVTHPYRWRFQSVYVSIHTPTQGVTQSGNRNKQGRHVSIHTPTQGVTLQNYPTVQMK